MKWNVKIDYCADVESYEIHGMTYHYYPKAKVETERELTTDEKTRINNAIVKAVAVELVEIESEAHNGN